jgi:hypothetical protein
MCTVVGHSRIFKELAPNTSETFRAVSCSGFSGVVAWSRRNYPPKIQPHTHGSHYVSGCVSLEALVTRIMLPNYCQTVHSLSSVNWRKIPKNSVLQVYMMSHLIRDWRKRKFKFRSRKKINVNYWPQSNFKITRKLSVRHPLDLVKKPNKIAQAAWLLREGSRSNFSWDSSQSGAGIA